MMSSRRILIRGCTSGLIFPLVTIVYNQCNHANRNKLRMITEVACGFSISSCKLHDIDGRILTKNGMCRQNLVNSPITYFVDIRSAVLE
jgi:hypothetical protein